jgi:hypothetical protein
MRPLLPVAIAAVLAATLSAQKPKSPANPERWVKSTLSGMSVEEKVGQLLVSSFQSSFIRTDSLRFEVLSKLVR